MTEACVRVFRDESALRFKDEMGECRAEPPDAGDGGSCEILLNAVTELFCLYKEPSIETRNRVWTVSSISHRLPLNILMDDHRTLDTATDAAANLIRLEWRGKRCVRVPHGHALIHIWLPSANKFKGGMLIDFEVPGIGFKKCHAKLYNNSDTIQLFGCGIRVEYAQKAYTELKRIMGKLHPRFGSFANDETSLPNFKFINENSKINLSVRVDDIGAVAKVIKADWSRHAECALPSVFSVIQSVRMGKSRMYITVNAENRRAVITLFESGRGHISARTTHSRVLAWGVILKLVEMYGSHFIRTHEDINCQNQTLEASGNAAPRRHYPNFSAQRSSPY